MDMTDMTESRLVEILLVEDNPADVILVQEALRRCPIRARCTLASDGEDALRFLLREKLKLDLVLLDLHLPRMNGLSVLEKYNPKTAPVVIFSSNCSETDAQRALDLGADECVEKPSDLGSFIATICGVVEKWGVPVAP
jgi:chemotaxis family two-component system response regulator Rcp1